MSTDINDYASFEDMDEVEHIQHQCFLQECDSFGFGFDDELHFELINNILGNKAEA